MKGFHDVRCFMSALKLTAFFAFSACLAQTQDPARPPDPPQQELTLAALAGEYYLGDGLGIRCKLLIEPKGHFAHTWQGCVGLIDLNTGPVDLVDGHLKLKPERPNVFDGFHGSATNLVPVSWGDRTYLVPHNRMKLFCDAVNRGDEPRKGYIGNFYLRRRPDGKMDSVSGSPDVPKEWQPLLVKKPLRSKVIIDSRRVKPGG